MAADENNQTIDTEMLSDCQILTHIQTKARERELFVECSGVFWKFGIPIWKQTNDCFSLISFIFSLWLLCHLESNLKSVSISFDPIEFNRNDFQTATKWSE